ncbi:RDD family protein [Flavobacterium plurextorum]|uniref:RDD family protein n=1 Tax=Flavobacterium plurextorum TaxID=1114867 RepID=A0ABX4CQX5_9FLAO|nr:MULTISPECIES: RDD family protein [Flavobacterium]OXB04561.1 RDD family protein [Flavobacterium plurextorum]PIF59880.1 putative RDD family membrane protein YckC [Flavobacterium sp. 2]UUW11443.1 RDD family protein [Flavobacterium plurextorum]
MSELSINTTQNVRINFIAATVGERMGAYFIDLGIKLSYIIVVSLLVFYWLDLGPLMDNLDTWSRGAIFLMLYFPLIIYSITLESIFEGQSFGKKLVKIKVVKIDGYQAGFGDYLMRWFFRIIDFSSFYGLVGLIAVVSSKKAQRLGDMAAGTAVITLKNKINISHTILEEIGDAYVPTYPLVIKLSDNDMRIIKETYQKAEAKNDHEVIYKLVAKIENVTGIKNQSGNNIDFIRIVLKDYNFYTQNM